MAVSYGLHIAVVIGCISLFAWGCDGGEPEHASGTRRTPPAVPAGYRVVDVVNGGSLSGSVTWVGARPEAVVVAVAHHREVCGETQTIPALVLGPRGGVSGTVVYLDGITEGRALDTSAHELAFRDCALTPRVVAMPLGATLALVDDEEVLHNLRGTWTGGSVLVDVGLPSRGSRELITPERTGLATLRDDAGHPWIGGFVHVFEHPYYQVTTDEGRFRIMGIPPGQYMLRAWHEGVRNVGGSGEAPRLSAPLVLARPVAITAGTETEVDFQLDLAAVDAAGD